MIKKNNTKYMTKRVNEALSADINWGDSLVGRLINSFIRKAKIGYNQTKIEPLLDRFKSELDSLLAGALSKETKDKFIKLLLKSYLSNIEDIVNGTRTPEEKLDTLIGGHVDMWDSKKELGEESGKWKEVLGENAYLRSFYEYIDDKVDETMMDKAGFKKTDVLNQISIFIDNLRKLTVDEDISPTTHNATITGFVNNFKKLVNKLSNVNASLKITSFYEFINESNAVAGGETLEVGKIYKNKNTNKEFILRSITNKIGMGTDKMWGTEDDKKMDELEPGVIFGEYKNKDGKYLDGQSMVSNISNIVTLDNKPVKIKQEPQNNQDSERESVLKRIKEICSDLSDEGDNFKTSEDILGDERCTELLNLLTKITDEDKNKIGESDTELINLVLDEARKEKEETSNDKSDNEEETTNDSVVYNFSLFLNEASTPGPTGPTGSSPNPSPNSNKNLDDSIKQTFDAFIGTFKDNAKITQQEVDELNKMLAGRDNEALALDLSNNPDPIIAICRIFRNAYELFFTPVIPSGRTNGKVSNSVLREYMWVGTGNGPSLNENNAYGAWVHKKTFNMWRDGVKQIIQDQKYRKILANVKFVVAGSEDEFNKESVVIKWTDFQKIFEADAKTDNQGHGQILFDFINDMLNKEGLSDFEEKQHTLLSKYFKNKGLNLDNISKKMPTLDPRERDPDKNDIDANSLVWENVTTITSQDNGDNYKGSFYAIPIKQTIKGDKIIFAHILSKITVKDKNDDPFKNCLIVKFTYNKPKIVEKWRDAKKRNHKLSDWDFNPFKERAFYGIMTPIKSNKFKMVYANVANGGDKIKDVYYQEFVLQPGKVDGKNIFLAKLVEYDSSKNKKEIKNIEFGSKVKNEEPGNKVCLEKKFKNEGDGNSEKQLLEHLTEKFKKEISQQ